MSVFRFRSFGVLSGLILFGLAAVFLDWNSLRAKAQISRIAQAPATQGRELTPAGRLLMDAATNLPAVGALPVNFVRSPDSSGADGKGRFLIAVNSGYGLQFNSKSKPLQSLSIIDLNAAPSPQVVENIYFPAPTSANFGAAFTSEAENDGSYLLFVAGGFENRIWVFEFRPNEKQPVSPADKTNDKQEIQVAAPFIDVAGFTENAPLPAANGGQAQVYPTGIALSPDDRTLFVANNLSENLGIVEDWRGKRQIRRVSLSRLNSTQQVYPYDIKVLPARDGKTAAKVYVSLWADASVAVVNLIGKDAVSHISVERHPTTMIFNQSKSRLYVVNSDADSVSVIDTATDKVLETINVKLAERELNGASPEGLALSEDEKTLYVANSRANAVAVVSLESGVNSQGSKKPSRLLGFIPTGQYPSAVAVIGNQIFVGNGKGTGVENSSSVVNNSGRFPNAPNALFPAEDGRGGGGQYSVSIVSGNFSLIKAPNERELFDYSQAAMRNNGLLGQTNRQIFQNGKSPFKHVIYVIRENRSYDQVFGDVEKSGDGTKADGDANLAIFGASSAARSPNGETQNITPNARALASRFGLLDRFFVNAEASPDGHNWSTAAFSSDYVDKAFRWNYGRRGRTYDFEGFNRMPNFESVVDLSPFRLPITENDLNAYIKQFIPYLNGNRDVAEPETLYLWDAANRAGLSYRNYGEFVGTTSADTLKSINSRQARKYPDTSETAEAVATKKSLENHFSPNYRNFDLNTPDIFTIESYKSARQSNSTLDPALTKQNPNAAFRGYSRFDVWQTEFRQFVANLNDGKGDTLPNFSIVRLPNDHASGLRKGAPTPQFYVAENDYALGRLVEEVSASPYWKDTAIFVVEDDAQDGPDHVDAHRSPALVISAYNRKGALVHDFHNTVSLIRTMEICLGIAPMNFLDAHAAPLDIFTGEPDFTPFKSVLPVIALDNLTPPEKPSKAMLSFMKLTDEQNLEFADMANPRELNEIIWYSVRGESEPLPVTARLPAFDVLTAGIKTEKGDEDGDE